MGKISKADQWRKDMGFSYQDLADRIGCSRQYALNLCKHGTAGVARAFRAIQLSGGVLTLEDFISEEEKEKLRREGFDVAPPRGPEQGLEEDLVI